MNLNSMQAASIYGQIQDDKWADEIKWCMIVSVPEQLSDAWTNTLSGGNATKIYCNKDMAGPLINVMNDIVSADLCDLMQSFDGCYMVRRIRGVPDQWSAHSWAGAIDINAASNPLGGSASIDMRIVQTFEKQGFTWGGRFGRKDPMHFSWLGF